MFIRCGQSLTPFRAPGHLRTFHLITADYPFNISDDIDLIPESVLANLEASMTGTGTHAKYMSNPNRAMIDELSDNPGGIRKAGDSITQRSLPSISHPVTSRLMTTWRVAQIPTWLDFSRLDPITPDHPYHPSLPRQNVVRTVEHAPVPQRPTIPHSATLPIRRSFVCLPWNEIR